MDPYSWDLEYTERFIITPHPHYFQGAQVPRGYSRTPTCPSPTSLSSSTPSFDTSLPPVLYHPRSKDPKDVDMKCSLEKNLGQEGWLLLPDNLISHVSKSYVRVRALSRLITYNRIGPPGRGGAGPVPGPRPAGSHGEPPKVRLRRQGPARRARR
eukprot:205905-Hanusia_phi.AAC.1